MIKCVYTHSHFFCPPFLFSSSSFIIIYEGVAPVTKGPSMGVSRRRPKLKEEDGQTRDSGMDSLTSIVGGPGPAVKPAAITPTEVRKKIK